MAAELAEVNRNTATYYFQRLRELIFQYQEEHTMLSGEIEVDEGYSVKRPLGLAGLEKVREAEGLLGKHLYLLASFRVGLLKRGGKVYAGTPFRVRINHSEKFVDRKNHINGIENFWNQAKRHLRKFNGIPKVHLYLFLRECEWRL